MKNRSHSDNREASHLSEDICPVYARNTYNFGNSLVLETIFVVKDRYDDELTKKVCTVCI